MAKLFFDWKVHFFCIIFVVVAELIGSVTVGPISVLGANISFTIFPMLFAMLFGIIFYLMKFISKEMMDTASPYIGIATMWLIVKLALGIGPNMESLINSGPIFILQELGNLGTALLSIPIAIFVFKMGRQAIGAGFSKSREPSIALISSKYGLDSPEGQGVMGAYVAGTVLGTLFCGILASIVISTGFFNPIALAMAAGSGSASMMAAFLAPMQDAYPHMWEDLLAYASMSNLITSATGIYSSLFLVLPLCNWLYKVFNGDAIHQKHMKKKRKKAGVDEFNEETTKSGIVDSSQDKIANNSTAKKETKKESLKQIWFVRGKVLFLSGIFSGVANWINTTSNDGLNSIGFWEGLVAMVFLAIPVIIGCVIYDFVSTKTKINVPSILYISLIGILMSIPGVPFAEVFVYHADKIDLMPLTVPILAYAGISLGKDLKSFKEQGFAIICITMLAFTGTYLGSAIIAHILLYLSS